MHESTVRRLAWIPYDASSIDAKLADLAELLHASAWDCEAAGDAAMTIRKVRRLLRRAIRSLDEDVATAALAMEQLEPPPF